MYICKYEILADLNLAVAKIDYQTVKFNSPPNFPVIYTYNIIWYYDFTYHNLLISQNLLTYYAPINVMPHLPHPGDMWG